MSEIRLREYQDGSIMALWDHWRAGGGHALIDLATGLGKSIVIAKLIKDLITEFPTMRFLMLVDSQELVEQNFLALMRLWPQAPAGIYAAGLGKRDAHHQITFASIQSVFRKGVALGRRQLVLVDEAQMIPHDGEGMYRTLLDKLMELEPNLRLVGLTATPFRMKGGSLVGSDGSLFEDIVYSYGLGDGIRDGWLTPLVGRRGGVQVDVTKVARAGGEFTDKGMAAAFDQEDITKAAVADMHAKSEGRRGWLVFCSGVQHAQNVRDELRASGLRAEAIWGDMDKGERRRHIAAFKGGLLDALTNDAILVKGFDAPLVRLIALLGATLSPGKIMQIGGRGTRTIYPVGFSPNDATAAERCEAIAAGPKPDCLILDYAGNLRRHGPLDLITVGPKVKRKKGEVDPDAVKPETVRGKECPQCEEINGFTARTCRGCDHEFPMETGPKHEAEAEDVAVLSRELKKSVTDEVPVVGWSASPHAPDMQSVSLKVIFSGGVAQYPEWVTFEHFGKAKDRAHRWWATHGGASPPPRTTSEAIARFGELKRPLAITVKKNGKWFDITGRRFALSQDNAA